MAPLLSQRSPFEGLGPDIASQVQTANYITVAVEAVSMFCKFVIPDIANAYNLGLALGHIP